MLKREKLLARLMNAQGAFTWAELEQLLRHYGYTKQEGSGSWGKFCNGDPMAKIILHKPHPGNELKRYIRKEVLEKLRAGGLI